MPILQFDKDLLIQPTYYGFKRRRTDSFKGSKTQVIYSFSVLLSFLILKVHFLYIT